jgi:hypothetical protein
VDVPAALLGVLFPTHMSGTPVRREGYGWPCMETPDAHKFRALARSNAGRPYPSATSRCLRFWEPAPRLAVLHVRLGAAISKARSALQKPCPMISSGSPSRRPQTQSEHSAYNSLRPHTSGGGRIRSHITQARSGGRR